MVHIMIGNGNIYGTAKSEEPDSSKTTVEISLLDEFEEKVTISQVVCEPKPELERCDGQTTETTPEPPALSPPADSPTSPNVEPETMAAAPTTDQALESKWSVGAQCSAVWSEDGRVYAATVQTIEGDRCRVRFDGYGNEEDMPLSSLKPAETQPKTQGAPWRPAFGAGARRKREVPDFGDKRESERERGERGDRGGRDRRDLQHSTWPKDRGLGPSREEGVSEERRPPDRTTTPTFMTFPPFPPPPLPPCSRDAPAYVPPPPPFWAFGAKEPSGPLDPTSHMLMLWYMCGFHTGSYLAQTHHHQSPPPPSSKSSTRD